MVAGRAGYRLGTYPLIRVMICTIGYRVDSRWLGELVALALWARGLPCVKSWHASILHGSPPGHFVFYSIWRTVCGALR